MKKQNDRLFLLLLLVAVPTLNYLGSLVASTLSLPLFFDSLGTILGVVLGGFAIGAVGGGIYNLCTAFSADDPKAAIWALSSIFIAFLVWQLKKNKKLKLDNYESVFQAGMILAILNSFFTTLLSLVFFHGQETFPPAVILQNLLLSLVPNNLANLFAVHLLVELLDKSLIFLLVFGIYKLLKQKEKISLKSLGLPTAVLVVSLGFTAWMNGYERINYEKLDQDLLIKNQTQQAVSMLETVHEGYQDGMYSFEQAQNMGASLLRNLRYGDKNDGYFWADTSDGTNVVLYGRKDVEGKNRIDSSVDGIYHVREIIANGKKPGGGYTDYFYTKKDGTQPLAKRGYSLYFKPFDWIVGTGYYLEDLN